MKLFNKKEPKRYSVKGRNIVCTCCNNDLFWYKKAQLNSAITTFFKLDWTDRSATCFVCSECTQIMWFLGE